MPIICPHWYIDIDMDKKIIIKNIGASINQDDINSLTKDTTAQMRAATQASDEKLPPAYTLLDTFKHLRETEGGDKISMREEERTKIFQEYENYLLKVFLPVLATDLQTRDRCTGPMSVTSASSLLDIDTMHEK